MSGDDDQMWKPVTREDVTDLALLPGEMRAFRTEMRDEIRSIADTLKALVRIEQRLDVAIDRQNVADARMDNLERRVAALESKPKRRTAARKK